MSIESQATFYYRNVCDYDPDIRTNNLFTKAVIEGFHEFSNLLRVIYKDWNSNETSTVESIKTKIGIMTDDLENYHNLTYTLDCLYAISTVGVLCFEDKNTYLRIDKALFKSTYKKTAATPFNMLKKYGFDFRYFKGESEVSEYKRCDSFCMNYKNQASLLESMKLLAQFLSEQEKQKEMSKEVAFMLADYFFILTGNLNVDSLQKSITNTLGLVGKLWVKLVEILQNECKLTADFSFNPYVFPNRTVTFKRNKKTICKFGIQADQLDVRLPLSFEIAKELITKRKTLPKSIDENISLFNCVNCGKCENRSNIIVFEGVSLCNLSYTNFVTEDSRCLRFAITSAEEVEVISDIMKQSLQTK